MVVVYAANNRANVIDTREVPISGTQNMIKYDYAQRTGLVLYQCLHLTVIDSAQLFVVEEVGHRRIVTDQTEALSVKG